MVACGGWLRDGAIWPGGGQIRRSIDESGRPGPSIGWWSEVEFTMECRGLGRFVRERLRIGSTQGPVDQ